MSSFELKPINGRKSFGNKARVLIEGSVCKLLSYETIVAEYNEATKEYKENGKYSMTTNTHIKAFKDFYNIT